jgi:succinate dehydrogenase / fumarate reductase cytochrome b subunit
MVGSNQPSARPLSPHLQIYRPEINMVMSILHRISGAALYVGTLLLVLWLLAAAMGPTTFEIARAAWSSWLGRFVLLGYTWALMLHTAGGLRHLIWDTGRGLDIRSVDRLCWWSLVASVLATLAVWGIGYWMRGAL